MHAGSQEYGLGRYLEDPTRLSSVVEIDRSLLGALDGLDVVHLQCHIGTDTLSLARLGARSVTGYDFSPAALAVGREFVAAAGSPVDFVEGELYDALEHLGAARFDLVYTGVGALCWLPDVRGWARIVAGLLRPGGRLVLREAHPVLWSLDYERRDGLLVMRFPYFETADPVVIDEPGTYTDGDASGIEHTVTAEWNHGLGEVVGALLDAGLVVTHLRETREIAWNALPDLLVERADGWFVARDPDVAERLPLMYTLEARRPEAPRLGTS
mgnify:FL=1